MYGYPVSIMILTHFSKSRMTEPRKNGDYDNWMDDTSIKIGSFWVGIYIYCISANSLVDSWNQP